MFYEVSIKFDQVQETGLVKKVTEKIIFLVETFGEAEAKAMEYISPYCNGEYDIVAIRRQEIAQVFRSNEEAADRWYKAKIVFTCLDERTGKEKRTQQTVMVLAKDFDDARNILQNGMAGSLGDWEKAVVAETPITDIV